MGLFTAAGAYFGKQYAQPDVDIANADYDKANQELLGLNAPTLRDVSASQQGPSAFNGIQEDPRIRQAAMDALDKFGEVGASGYTGADRAGIAGAMGDVATANRGQREALLQRSEMTGGGGQGSLIAQLLGQQAQATDANRAGNALAIAGRNRALDAYGQQAGLASNIRGQDFSRDAARAQANDSISRFNTELADRAKYYNSGLTQQDFNNRMQVGEVHSGAHRQAGNDAMNRADATIGQFAGQGAIGDGILNAGTSFAGTLAGAGGGGGMGGSTAAPAGGYASAPQMVGYEQPGQSTQPGNPDVDPKKRQGGGY